MALKATILHDQPIGSVASFFLAPRKAGGMPLHYPLRWLWHYPGPEPDAKRKTPAEMLTLNPGGIGFGRTGADRPNVCYGTIMHDVTPSSLFRPPATIRLLRNRHVRRAVLEAARRDGELDASHRGRRLPRRKVPRPPGQAAGMHRGAPRFSDRQEKICVCEYPSWRFFAGVGNRGRLHHRTGRGRPDLLDEWFRIGVVA